MIRFIKRNFRRAFFTCLLFLIVCTGINIYIYNFSSGYIYEDSVPKKYTALILGAATYPGGKLSHVYHDRLVTGEELLRAGKVSRILVSADHRRSRYDESNAGLKFLLKQGIKKKYIFTDHAGFDTYDSIIRARQVFKVDSVIIVTQRYHLYRALYIARSLGLDAAGYAADKRSYDRITFYRVREFFSNIKAFFEVMIHASPAFYGEPVPITGDSSLSDG